MRTLAGALAAGALAAATLAGLLSGCIPTSPLGAGPVGNPPDGPGNTAGQVASTAPAWRLPPESVPPYFLAFAGPTGPANPVPWQPAVTVRVSSTGQTLAVVGAPGNPGTFAFVSASAGDGRTFLVGAQPWKLVDGQGQGSGPVSFYLLRFDPARRRAHLTPLPVPGASVTGGPVLVSAALSPDGTRLAVAEAEPGKPGNGNVLDVHVYPVPEGGPGQTWKVAGGTASDVIGARLSWSANDRALAAGLAFGTVRLLDTAVAPGRAAGTEDITLGVKDGYQCYYPVLMTSDGSKLICGVAADYFYREASATEPARGGFAVYDIRTGDLTAVLGAQGPGQRAGGRVARGMEEQARISREIGVVGSSSPAEAHALEGFASVYDEWAEQSRQEAAAAAAGDPKWETPTFIHLKDARVHAPGAQEGLPGTLWRGRLEDVNGWSIGTYAIGH